MGNQNVLQQAEELSLNDCIPMTQQEASSYLLRTSVAFHRPPFLNPYHTLKAHLRPTKALLVIRRAHIPDLEALESSCNIYAALAGMRDHLRRVAVWRTEKDGVKVVIHGSRGLDQGAVRGRSKIRLASLVWAEDEGGTECAGGAKRIWF